ADNLSLPRSTVLIQNPVETHEVFIRNDGLSRTRFTSHGLVTGSLTSVDNRASREQKVNLKSSLSELNRSVDKLPAEVRLQLGIRVEVQGVLREVIEETKVFHGSFQLQTGEADTVNPATILSK